ncbi:MAG: hypothetical protein DWI12_12640 [Planctomycetota bacterium]|nr:MAG: hypothetical protein DWI12_12640 [Planctomycetota bacterium]
MLGCIVLCHHEKWNGSGYPRQLVGEAIRLFARVVAVADVFDALSSKRAYKEAWTREQIFALFRRESGQYFDLELASIFSSIKSKRNAFARVGPSDAPRYTRAMKMNPAAVLAATNCDVRVLLSRWLPERPHRGWHFQRRGWLGPSDQSARHSRWSRRRSRRDQPRGLRRRRSGSQYWLMLVDVG